jgi:hypothetical protein
MEQKHTDRLKTVVRVLALVLAIIVVWWLLFAEKDNHVAVNVDDGINITPEQIESIRSIGQWEFLSVSTEELVDTTRRRLLRDDQLVRIYYGTLRLGVDMKQVEPGWIEQRNDTLFLTLPKVGLLDRDFIDEARTKSFFESGTWKAEDREALYKRAHRKMLAHCLTPANLSTAEGNARESFKKLLRSMGYKNIEIQFKQ